MALENWPVGWFFCRLLNRHCHHGRHHDPLSAPLSGGIACVTDAGGGTGFIIVGHRLLTGAPPCFCHRLRQCCPQAPVDRCDCPTADLHPQQLIQQRLLLLKLNGKALPRRPTRALRRGL
jgi:hypothetical protein